MSDIAQQIADLEQARDALPSDSPARASLDVLIAQLRAVLPQPVQSGEVHLGVGTAIDRMGDAVQNRANSVAQLAQALFKQHKTGSRAWAVCVLAAGELLAQTKRRQPANFGEARVWDDTVAALRRIVESRSRTRAKPRGGMADRVRAGRVLGQLGDPRPGVCSLEPDWCIVPYGPFQMGSNDTSAEARHDGPQRTVDLPTFRISRYPVTNAQWRAFVEAGGYRERRWWSDAGWAAKEREDWTQPQDWHDPRFNGANQPVVGISWYEATAFCRWLSAELGYAVRLPSSAEWEKAARGVDGRVYPWGDDWGAARANTYESSIGTTTPVGCFPDGASPYGALDMNGNVCGWTATPWTIDYYEGNGTARETEGGEAFVVRGGAFCYYLARCAFRFPNGPASRFLALGVRVVAALTPDD